MLNSIDPDDFKYDQASKMDEQLLVRFYIKEREDKAATLKEGRPMYKETEYIEIRIRGSRDPQASRPATYADKKRFPRHYEAFQKRIEMPETGTPLSQWPQISRNQIEELSFLGVKTVDQLSELNDTHVSKLRNGFTLKRLASEWLESSGETALIAEREQLRDQIAELQAAVKTLMEPTAGVPSELVDTGLDLGQATEKEVEVAKTAPRRRDRKAKS